MCVAVRSPNPPRIISDLGYAAEVALPFLEEWGRREGSKEVIGSRASVLALLTTKHGRRATLEVDLDHLRVKLYAHSPLGRKTDVVHISNHNNVLDALRTSDALIKDLTHE